jgi:hypothetical protein
LLQPHICRTNIARKKGLTSGNTDATIEVAVAPFEQFHTPCGPIPPTMNEAVGFDSIAITLPGWRRLVVGREKFGPPMLSREWPISYQYTFPPERNEFERLFQSAPGGHPMRLVA